MRMDGLTLVIRKKFLGVRVSHGTILKNLGMYSQNIIGSHQYHQYNAIIHIHTYIYIYVHTHLNNMLYSDLKFFNNFPICIMQTEAICHLATTPGIILFILSSLCVLCSSNVKLLAVVSNMLFSLPRALSFLSGKLLLVRTLFCSFLQNGHLIKVPWLFKALLASNWMIP